MEETKTKTKKTAESSDFSVQEMSETGMHFGHKTFRTHPKMKPHVSGTRGGVHMIDLEKTAQGLKEALDFVKTLISSGKKLLLVGTKVQVKNIVKETAKEADLFYINERWLGGTFTNFGTIKKRLDYFKDLESKKATGQLAKYTKKERAKIDKKLMDLEAKFGGIKNLEKLPDAIFVLDMRKDYLAIKEANEKNIPVIAIADTDIDPSVADFPIPANDDAIPAVKYILEKLKETVLKNKPEK